MDGWRLDYQLLACRKWAIIRLQKSNDAGASRSALRVQHYDWIVVDHYGLGVTWEEVTAAIATRMFVIDDLGRPHHCDLLLDQNYRNSIMIFTEIRCLPNASCCWVPEFALVRRIRKTASCFNVAPARRPLSHLGVHGWQRSVQ